MEELKDRAAMFLEAEFNISGDEMVEMNHDLDNIPLTQRGAFNLHDIMAAFVESERGQKADTGEKQCNLPVVRRSAFAEINEYIENSEYNYLNKDLIEFAERLKIHLDSKIRECDDI